MLTPLGWGSWFMFALHWAGKVVYGYSPLGDLVLGLLPTGEEGGLHDYSPLGERVGFWVTSCWGSWFNGYFLLGKLVSGLLPSRGEGGLHDYSPLGERVGFYDHFSLAMLGFMCTSEKKEKRGNISKR